MNISDAHAVAAFWLKMRAIITEASGTKVGLETTDATSELLREAMTWADQAYDLRASRAAEAKREPDPVFFGLSEEKLASFVNQARSSHGSVTFRERTILLGRVNVIASLDVLFDIGVPREFSPAFPSPENSTPSVSSMLDESLRRAPFTLTKMSAIPSISSTKVNGL